MLRAIRTEMGRYIRDVQETTLPATGQFTDFDVRHLSKQTDTMTGHFLPLALFDFFERARQASSRCGTTSASGRCALSSLLAICWFVLQALLPKMAAIAWTTAKEALVQPLFYMLLAVGFFLIVLLLYIPYYTFGEDTKFFEENALTLVMLLAIILALWTASSSVAEEIEGRTALTVLCKPISRRDFVLGKFLGILGPVAILFIVLGAFYLTFVSIKVVYDARECSLPEPNSAACYAEVCGWRRGCSWPSWKRPSWPRSAWPFPRGWDSCRTW